jgi:hypothetical protein
VFIIGVDRSVVNAAGEGVRSGEMATRDMVEEKVVFG